MSKRIFYFMLLTSVFYCNFSFKAYASKVVSTLLELNNIVSNTKEIIKENFNKKELNQRSLDYSAFNKQKKYEREYVAKYNKWFVMLDKTDPKNKICYAISTPKAHLTNSDLVLEPYIIIYKNLEKNRLYFTTSSGYNYASEGNTSITTDYNSPYFLNIIQEHAWPKSNKMNDLIVSNLISAQHAVIRGVSQNNHYSVDKYDLSGIEEAVNELLYHCKTKKRKLKRNLQKKL